MEGNGADHLSGHFLLRTLIKPLLAVTDVIIIVCVTSSATGSHVVCILHRGRDRCFPWSPLNKTAACSFLVAAGLP